MDQEQGQEIINDQFVEIITNIIKESNVAEHFKQLKTYINGNKPSYNLLDQSFNNIITPELQKLLGQNLVIILEQILNLNVQRVFVRVLFTFLNKVHGQLDIAYLKEQGIRKLWDKLNPLEIKEFIRLFQFEDEISTLDQIALYKTVIKKKKFDDAIQFYIGMQFEKKEFKILMDAMSNNHDCGKAADYIKRLNYNPDEYPQVMERLQKNCMRYMFKEYPWFKCEELLGQQKQLLAFLCEDLYFSGQKPQALSIIKRNGIKDLISKQDIKKQIDLDFEQGFEELPNILFTQDDFMPIDQILVPMSQYIQCGQFGFTEEKIKFISEDEQLDAAIQDLLNSKVVGLDTESLTPMTKLDKQGPTVYLIQISNQERAYLFDAFSLQNNQKFKDFLKQFLQENDIIKVGLALRDDLLQIVRQFHLQPIIIRSIIDVGSVFKQLGQDKGKQSLAFISEFYFKKPLSKLDCCSDWSKRPLRRAQTHYAALDAIICLEIFKEMEKINAEILLGEKDVLQVNE